MSRETLPAGISFVASADGITEYRLTSNSMKVLLIENRVAPVATFLVVYKVGSRNEAVGHTGATHLLEHMMFKGTPTFNSATGTQIAATLQRIGADFNATTWYDRTNYFETVASDQLELAIKLEADRMRNSLIADSDRQSEMTVVRNELDRGQNEPSSVLDETVYATAFIAHPYHHPTIGWRSDVEGVSTDRLKEFYNTFYHPNNATAVLVGDFDRDHALELILKYFSAYSSSDVPIPEVYTEEPPQQGDRRVIVRRAGELPLVQISFRTPAALGQLNVLSDTELAARAANPPAENDTYPLAVLSTALTGGITSRLYQALVEKQLAVSINSNSDEHRDPGLFSIYATVMPDVEPETVERRILKEIKKIAKSGLTKAELSRAKQQILAHVAFGRDGTFNIAMQISECEAIADWRYFNQYSSNIERVTAADIKRVASRYLIEDGRTVGHFIPKVSAVDAVSIGVDLPSAPQALKSTEFGSPSRVSRRGIQFYNEPVDNSERSIVASSPAASASGFGIASRVNTFTLRNGATLLVLENKATPTVRIRGSLRAGSFFAPEGKWGLAQICAGMLERGSNRHTKLEIAERL
ncbi:MAG: insulinase family protein, partial [Pyrinomonadaceae bacterium]